WFYKNWRAMQAEGEKLNATARAIFYPLTAYFLFRHIGKRGEALGVAAGLPAGVLAVALFLLSLTSRMPDPWWLITFLSALPLLPVQAAINEINLRVAPDADRNTRYGGWNIFGLVVGGLLLVFVVFASFAPR